MKYNNYEREKGKEKGKKKIYIRTGRNKREKRSKKRITVVTFPLLSDSLFQ